MSFQIKIDPIKRAGGRGIVKAREALMKALVEEMRDNKLTRSEIAKRLGVHRSVVTKELSGTANLTIRRLGELAYIMGRDLDIDLPRKRKRPGQNSSPSQNVPRASKPGITNQSSPLRASLQTEATVNHATSAQ